MSTKVGQRAETVAADFLGTKGMVVLARNWRTRWCEIDIVAKRSNTIFFVEVKYRSNLAFGGGFDYITPRKLQQMAFAAELWLGGENTRQEYRLSAIELSGDPPQVAGWLEDVT